MIGVTAWPATAAPREPVDVRLVLASAAHPHTTRISGAYLDAALRGWAPEPWHDLIRPLAGARAGPPDALRAAVRRLLRIGETSGADALTGFCWAWRRLPA